MESKLSKYSVYKNSGVEWLGEIPEHWELSRVKNIFKLIIDPAPKNNDFELLSVYTDIGVKPRKELEERGNKASTTDGYLFVKKGDIVVNKLLAWMGAIGVSNYEGVTSPAYDILRAKWEIDSDYYHYLFRTNNCISELRKHSRGIMDMRLRLYFDKFADVIIPYPQIEQQREIVQFLNKKTALIEQAIEIKEKQIELLKERRQILIHQAVTKGLDKNVKFKDSGVEWIGEIPEGWEVNKLFGLCRFVRGNSTFSKDDLLSNGQYVALQYGKTYKVNEVDKNYNFYVNDEFYKDTQIVNYGDTIFISTSETIEDLGHSAFYNRSDLGLLGGEQFILKPDNQKINGHYLYFSSKLFSKELRKYATGIKVFRFNNDNLKTIYIAVPSLAEQKEISEFIENASQKIAIAISLKQKEIEKLKEYKASLINSTVTGKVRVS